LAKKRRKEPYEAPRIRKIRLALDELAVAACKSQQAAPNVCNRGGVFVVRNIGS
jgi:hypothetical protein